MDLIDPLFDLGSDPVLGSAQISSAFFSEDIDVSMFNDDGFIDSLCNNIDLMEKDQPTYFEDDHEPTYFEDDHNSYTSSASYLSPPSPSGSLSTGGSSSPTNTISSSSETHFDILDLATAELGSPISSPPPEEYICATNTKVCPPAPNPVDEHFRSLRWSAARAPSTVPSHNSEK